MATFWSHWSVVGASWIGLFFHFGSLLINTFGIFLTSLCAEFGWTRAEVSLAFTLAMVTAMISMPVAGWVTDRHGSRWLIIGATTLYGLALAALAGQSGAYWQLVAIFLLLGLLGPGTSAIPHATLLARRRSARAGLALGVAMSGTAVGGIVWPAAAQYLLDRFGLRTGYLLLG
ncbi:MAG: MFS transporter, partial [Acidobacteriota bacterium]